MANGFSKWVYKFTLARWYYNFAYAWIIGYFLSTFAMIVTIYYLIPGLSAQISFLQFLFVAGLLLVGAGWGLGKILVKELKVQPIENYISSEVNPFTNATLTAKERVFWKAMAVLLKKEHAKAPDPEILTCVKQLEKYIHGQVKFDFEELDKFELGKNHELDEEFAEPPSAIPVVSNSRASKPDPAR
ncbi:hypothetical protein AUG19_09385 [archaeon 13_1_20CM_2_54_9]|nr:MAG: hypothetical protein AUJ07_08355 [Crenarchaeota archaeon 13_1_40CM_3_53_5]OLE74317.1 MAG: hypothetical protein AUG19_09385 [archaeon 13_1_20CM_2_54_9]